MDGRTPGRYIDPAVAPHSVRAASINNALFQVTIKLVTVFNYKHTKSPIGIYCTYCLYVHNGCEFRAAFVQAVPERMRPLLRPSKQYESQNK